MMGLIIGAVLAIFIADAIYARARTKLLTRVAHATRPRSREIIHRSPEGWRSLDTSERPTEPEAEVESFSRIDTILGGNARRGPR
jgi:hypothetical protein